jgi:hypothetical protein
MRTSNRTITCALLIPFVLALSLPAEAAKKKAAGTSADAARTECFRQANAAAAGGLTTAEKNSDGVSAYRNCAQKAGIRP